MQQFDNTNYGGNGGGAPNEYKEYDEQQRAPPSKYNVRPIVNPEAEGEVDPNLYPQAKVRIYFLSFFFCNLND